MIETRHGLESNPVPTSILSFSAILALLGSKMDVGTGLFPVVDSEGSCTCMVYFGLV